MMRELSVVTVGWSVVKIGTSAMTSGCEVTVCG